MSGPGFLARLLRLETKESATAPFSFHFKPDVAQVDDAKLRIVADVGISIPDKRMIANAGCFSSIDDGFQDRRLGVVLAADPDLSSRRELLVIEPVRPYAILGGLLAGQERVQPFALDDNVSNLADGIDDALNDIAFPLFDNEASVQLFFEAVLLKAIPFARGTLFDRSSF